MNELMVYLILALIGVTTMVLCRVAALKSSKYRDEYFTLGDLLVCILFGITVIIPIVIMLLLFCAGIVLGLIIIGRKSAKIKIFKIT